MYIALLLVLCLLFPTHALMAQDSRGTISVSVYGDSDDRTSWVKVTESPDILSFDANVVVRNMFTGQSMADPIDSQSGVARFAGLQPGPYTISIILTDTGNALGPIAHRREYSQRRTMFAVWVLGGGPGYSTSRYVGALPIFPNRFKCTRNFEACLEAFYEEHRDQICGLSQSNRVLGTEEKRTAFHVLSSTSLHTRVKHDFELARIEELDQLVALAISRSVELSDLATRVGSVRGLEQWKTTLAKHTEERCYYSKLYIREFAENSLSRCESDRDLLGQATRYAGFAQEVRAANSEVKRHADLVDRVCAMPRQHSERPPRPTVGVTQAGAVVQEIRTADLFRPYLEFHGEARAVGDRLDLRLIRPLRDIVGNVTQRLPVAAASIQVAAAEPHYWRGAENRLVSIFPNASLRDGDELEVRATVEGGEAGRAVIRVKATEGMLSGLRVLNSDRQPVDSLTVGASYTVQAIYENLDPKVNKSTRVVAGIPGQAGYSSLFDSETLDLNVQGFGETPNTREAALVLVSPRNWGSGLSAPAGSQVRLSLDGRTLRLPVRAVEIDSNLARLSVALKDHQQNPLLARVHFRATADGTAGSFMSGSTVDLPPGRYTISVTDAFAVAWLQEVNLIAGKATNVVGPQVLSWTPTGGGEILIGATSGREWDRSPTKLTRGRASLVPAGRFSLYRFKNTFSHIETFLGRERRIYSKRPVQVGNFTVQRRQDGTATSPDIGRLFAPSLE